MLRSFYAEELSSVKKAPRHLDPGLLEPANHPGLGMAKMHARSRLGRYLVEFANGAAIHGLNHLVAPRRHVCERILVATIILAALGALIGVSLNSWHRYQHEATMLVLDTNFRKFEIAKPAITVCPLNLLDEKKFPEVFEKYNVSDTPETRKFLLGLSNSTYENVRESIDPTFDRVEPSKWLELLYELRADVRLETNYDDEPFWVSTERGLCLVYASRTAVYSSVEYFRSINLTKSIKNDEPEATTNFSSYGIVVSFTCKSHDFWVAMHHPATVTEYATKGATIKRMTLTTPSMDITEVDSSPRARRLSVGQRGCKLPQDGGLAVWPVYSNAMCRLECRYRQIRKLCGCSPHFAPPLEGVPTCNASQLHCVGEHGSSLILLQVEELEACGCLPDCNSALYIAKDFSAFPLKDGSTPDAIINLNFNFPKVKYILEEFYGLSDFLASVGGAAGLFLGASVLSLFEIVHFSCLRLVFYYSAERRAERRIKNIMKSLK